METPKSIKMNKKPLVEFVLKPCDYELINN